VAITSRARAPALDATAAPCPAEHCPTVVIVAPVRVHRELLAAALDETADLAVLRAAATPEEALGGAGLVRPDVVLLDASTERGLGTIQLLAKVYPAVGLVALAAPEDDEAIVRCAAAGVAGFVARDGSLADIVATTRAVARGDAVCSPRVTAALLRRVGATGQLRDGRADLTRLTARERQILRLIDDGLSNKEIAGRLYIEVSTVKNHVHNILAKLGARRRSEAAAQVRPVFPR
jgi:DNA-binding NarL/FixJ family response regulator